MVVQELLVFLLEPRDLTLETSLNLKLLDPLLVDARDRIPSLTQLRLAPIGDVSKNSDAAKDLAALIGERRIVAVEIDLPSCLPVGVGTIARRRGGSGQRIAEVAIFAQFLEMR